MSNQSLAIPNVIREDWKRLDLIVRKVKLHLGQQSSPTFTGLTLTGLTASRLIWTDADKALASKDLIDLVAGTANEVDITDDGDGSITVGIVNPLIVAKGGTGVATLTDHGILLGSGTGAITPLGVATNGQLPIGSTGADPVLATVTGTANQVTVTNAAGSITLSLPQDYHTGASPTLATLTLSTIAHETTDVDKFLVENTGLIKYRTGAEVLSDIGASASGHDHSGVYEPADAGLTSLAGLTYASDSFIKVTATDTYAIRTIAETKTDLSLNLVENTALSTWAGTTNITTLGTIATGSWEATDVGIAHGGTGQSTAQAAINALSAVSGATNEHVLTKDTTTGNAIFKVAAAGGTPAGADTNVQYNDGGSFGGDANFTWGKTNSDLTLTSSVTQKPTINLVNTNADNNAGRLIFTKTSASQADDDFLGFIFGYGKDSGGTSTLLTSIALRCEDITNGDEAGSISLRVAVDGTVRQLLDINGYTSGGPAVGEAYIVINEEAVDCDVRIESTGDANAFRFVGSNGGLGLGIATPNDGTNYGKLTVKDTTDVASRGVCSYQCSNDAQAAAMSFLKDRGSLTTSCQDDDYCGVFSFSFINSTPAKLLAGTFGVRLADVTAGTEDASFYFNNMVGGAWTRIIDIVAGGLSMPLLYEDTVGGTNRDLYIDNTGKVGYVSSSIDYKTNIVDLQEWDSDRLHQLRPVKYDRVDGSAVGEIGLIAEEVAVIFPEVVSYKRRRIDESISNPTLDIVARPVFETTDIPETVNYSRLIVPLLKEVQELKKEIDRLKEVA